MSLTFVNIAGPLADDTPEGMMMVRRDKYQNLFYVDIRLLGLAHHLASVVNSTHCSMFTGQNLF